MKFILGGNGGSVNSELSLISYTVVTGYGSTPPPPPGSGQPTSHLA
jgi:hypothetical protein